MSTPPYSSRIIKASALIPDTKALLSAWDPALSVAENLDRARRENVLGRASRSRVEDVLAILRQRYFTDAHAGAALVVLAQAGAPDAWLVPLLYYYSARNDRALRDIVLELVYPRLLAGYRDLPVAEVTRALRDWVAHGRTTRPWNAQTQERVAQGVMATLRDFGVLEGAVHKAITPTYLALEPAAFIAMALQQREGSGRGVLDSPDWHLFLLATQAVERLLVEAHQEHLLSYHAAGSVIRLAFPADTLEDYARVLAQRDHRTP